MEEDVRILGSNPSGITDNAADVQRIQINTTRDKTLSGEGLGVGGLGADPLSSGAELKIPGVSLFGEVLWDLTTFHPTASPLEEGKVHSIDSHFDTKTYAGAFNYVRDLEAAQGGAQKIGTRGSGENTRNIYKVPFQQYGTQLNSILCL